MLGAAAAVLGAAAVGSSVLRETAIPTLRELLRRTQETVSLAIPKGDVMVFLHREQGPQPVAVSGQLGTSRPMHITSVGRAYLAALPGEQREDLLVRLLESPQYPIGVDDLPHIRAEIEATERRGWSADRREFDESSVCCGAAIYDEHGLPVAAISVAGVAGRMEGQLDEIGPQVRRAADLLSVTLGGRPPAFT
jgi:DNA-binding IclR family transcriptional regulator